MLIRDAKHFFSLLLLLFLLVACSPLTGNNDTENATVTSTQSSAPTTSFTPNANTMSDICPIALKKFSGCLTPHALRVAYGVESLFERGFTGKGQTVIDIVSFGSPTLQSDLDIFDKQFGLPPAKLKVISPLNKPIYDPRNDRSSWAEETDLDVEIIHAIAPDATIVVLTSPVAETEGIIGLPEFRQLVQYAVDNHLGNIISQSWGASEFTLQDQAGQQEIQQWNTLYQQITTQKGITIFSATGDNGATDFADLQGKRLVPTPTTIFAADSPWVTAVGGTSLSLQNGLHESVWNAVEGASGGGFSRFFPMPDYQKQLAASWQSQSNGRRGVPDVAADADPATAMADTIRGKWTLFGGTSAATPLWAGIMAIADQMAGHPLGFINPTLYSLASNPTTYARDFRDITLGNNSNLLARVTGYMATQGWDPTTGLGSPIADKLLPDMVAAMKQ